MTNDNVVDFKTNINSNASIKIKSKKNIEYFLQLIFSIMGRLPGILGFKTGSDKADVVPVKTTGGP